MTKKIKNTTKKSNKRTVKKGNSKIGRKVKVQRRSVPVAKSTTRRGSGRISFGTAPYNQELGSGIRVRAEFVGANITIGGSTNARATDCFSWPTATTSSVQSTVSAGSLVPSFWVQGIYDASNAGREASLFATQSSNDTPVYSNLAMIARAFRKCAIRYWRADYVSSCSTSQTGNLILGVNKDTGHKALYTYSVVQNMDQCMSTNLWQNASITVIDDITSKPAMRIFETDTQEAPLALVGATNVSVSSSVAATYGYLCHEVVIDLYGLTSEIRSVYVNNAIPKDMLSNAFASLLEEMKDKKTQDKKNVLSAEEDYVLPSSTSSSTSTSCSSSSSKSNLNVSRPRA